jgi:hypothetical protein
MSLAELKCMNPKRVREVDLYLGLARAAQPGMIKHFPLTCGHIGYNRAEPLDLGLARF